MDVYFTLDYELFMGNETGRVENCLLLPMQELLKVTDKYGVKYTIFVDAAYLLRLSELRKDNPNAEEDYLRVTEHIRDLSDKGHDIELHFHPQWLFSTMMGTEWDMDSDHYSLSDIPNVETIFIRSKSLLDNIIGKQTVAFRAGGYTLQPYKDYCELFKNSGIICDSSVLRNHTCSSRFQNYDYSDIPSKQLYHFKDDICKEDNNGEFVELTITNTTLTKWKYFVYRFYLKYFVNNNYKYGNGKPVATSGNNKLKKKGPVNIVASLDYVLAPLLEYVYRKCKQQDRLVFIGHPKNMSPMSLQILDRFLANHNDEFEYQTVRNII